MDVVPLCTPKTNSTDYIFVGLQSESNVPGSRIFASFIYDCYRQLRVIPRLDEEAYMKQT